MDKYDILFIFDVIKKLYKNRNNLYNKYLKAKNEYMKITIFVLRLKRTERYRKKHKSIEFPNKISKVGYLERNKI